jgi:CRISPR-associated protein Cas2
MFYLVTYDIQDDKRRLKTAKVLKDFGQRVQKSVFECILEEKHLEKMKKRVEGSIKQDEDGVRIYRLCSGCLKEIAIIGLGVVSEDEDLYVI